MFERLFAESGLSLDRVKAFLEVGAAGSIVKATGGDPVRQSQYSRQIKELEEFFQTKLVERHGKGIRLTTNGREVARISRFFLLGLSNFQRGCLGEEQTFRIGASAAFIQAFLLPSLVSARSQKPQVRYSIETTANDEIERRLHDLSLDFGVTTAPTLTRPLQLIELGGFSLNLWVPKVLRSKASALQDFQARRLPLVLASKELGMKNDPDLTKEAIFICDDFLQAAAALEGQTMAALLPDFLEPKNSSAFWKILIPSSELGLIQYRLAWNPRLLRLNPHAKHWRDLMQLTLCKRMRKNAD